MAACLTLMDEDGQGELLVFHTKFEGTAIELPPLSPDLCVGDLKQLLQDETEVPCDRQKLIGLVKGKLPSDSDRLGDMALKRGPPYVFTLMGTRDEKLFIFSPPSNLPEVFDDFDSDEDYAALSKRWHRSRRNAEKLATFTAKTEINWITPARPGKPLLVLDLDHALLDYSAHEDVPPETFKRPGMDAFLSSVYREYDLVVWSQTSWRWLETKLTELGMLSNPEYKICFVLDKTSMFRITSSKPSKTGTKWEEFRHYVKPLELIWAKCAPAWTAENTLHVDDLSRNFALNPKSGVKCRAYYRKDRATDQELGLLAAYLCHVARNPPPGRAASTPTSSSAATSLLSSSPSPSSASSPSQSAAASVEAPRNASAAATTATAAADGSFSPSFLEWDHSNWRDTSLRLLGM